MSALVAMILSVLPRVFLALAAALLKEEFLQDVLTKVIIAGLKHAVKLTNNTVDDEVVASVEKALAPPKKDGQ